jgi:hypothetical protein
MEYFYKNMQFISFKERSNVKMMFFNKLFNKMK